MNQLQQLRQRIEAMMSENEVIKANAMKYITVGIGSEDTSSDMWSKAKRENQAYQNVIELIEELVRTENNDN